MADSRFYGHAQPSMSRNLGFRWQPWVRRRLGRAGGRRGGGSAAAGAGGGEEERAHLLEERERRVLARQPVVLEVVALASEDWLHIQLGRPGVDVVMHRVERARQAALRGDVGDGLRLRPARRSRFRHACKGKAGGSCG